MVDTENKLKSLKPLKASFINRNLVTIVMIPALIALHWGWNEIQQNEVFVKPEERVELPIVTGAKLLWSKIQGTADDDSKK